jgi:hypothetical protein
LTRSATDRGLFTEVPDQPIIPTLPETECLKGFLLGLMPGW